MAKDRGKKDFEKLRSEAESMQSEETATTEAVPEVTPEKEESVLRTEMDAGDENDLNSQLEELVEVLEQELKDTSPMTLLVVFALGILIGRLLPR